MVTFQILETIKNTHEQQATEWAASEPALCTPWNRETSKVSQAGAQFLRSGPTANWGICGFRVRTLAVCGMYVGFRFKGLGPLGTVIWGLSQDCLEKAATLGHLHAFGNRFLGYPKLLLGIGGMCRVQGVESRSFSS